MFNFLLSHTPLLYLTQSLWRDEAYSVLLSQHSVLEIIKLTAQDFNPPLYYLLLHFWMNLFGSSEISVRLLSFIFHLLLVYVCYQFARKIFKSKFLTFNFSLLIFLNPMLLYYGFEARMYSLLAFLATASMYCLFTKKWKSHILFTSLGLWTQPFMALVIFSQIVYLFLCKRFNRSSFFSFLFSFLIFLPWLPTLVPQFLRSSSSWLWPISTSTLTTILGSLFTGYEGTPGNLWNLMTIISLVILFLSFFLFRHAEFNSASPPEEILKQVQDDKEQVQNDKIINFIKLLLCWLFLPVILVLTVSILKPIYVNRYLIFVTVAEVFLIITALSLIKNSSVRFLLTACYLLLTTYLLFQSVSFHQKQDIRQTLNEINYLAKPADLILAQTPLTIFETHYYARDPGRVFLYNPKRTKIPDYVGKNLIDKMKQTDSFPFYPQKAFLIHDDASYEMVYQR